MKNALIAISFLFSFNTFSQSSDRKCEYGLCANIEESDGKIILSHISLLSDDQDVSSRWNGIKPSRKNREYVCRVFGAGMPIRSIRGPACANYDLISGEVHAMLDCDKPNIFTVVYKINFLECIK